MTSPAFFAAQAAEQSRLAADPNCRRLWTGSESPPQCHVRVGLSNREVLVGPASHFDWKISREPGAVNVDWWEPCSE